MARDDDSRRAHPHADDRAPDKSAATTHAPPCPSTLCPAERCLAAIEAAAPPHGDSPVAPCVTPGVGSVQVQGQAADAGPGPGWLLAEAEAAPCAARQTGRRRGVMRG